MKPTFVDCRYAIRKAMRKHGCSADVAALHCAVTVRHKLDEFADGLLAARDDINARERKRMEHRACEDLMSSVDAIPTEEEDWEILSCRRVILMTGPRGWVLRTLEKSIGPCGIIAGPGKTLIELERTITNGNK